MAGPDSCCRKGVGGRKSESNNPVFPQMFVSEMFLPDEGDVVRTYKDIKTDAHQLCRSQENIPMRA